MGSIELSGPATTGPVLGPSIGGSIHGGQQVITGATIQLYEAGTAGTTSATTPGGYGGGAKALIPTGSYYPGGASGCVASQTQTCTTLPTSDSNGNFTITSNYSCDSASSEVYLVATGGNPGNTSGNANPFITLMAALGQCTSTNTSGKPALNANSYVVLNEVSTVGSAYALAQFLSTPSGSGTLSIGAPGTLYNGVANGVVGMQNAFNWVNTLVNIPYGNSPGSNPFAIVESSQIYTLANILASCINSDPNNSTSPSALCSTLMTDVTPSGATTATDTLQAAYYMVRNPYNNVAKIYGDKSATPPFPSVAQPTDFTLNVQLAPYFLSNATSPASNQPALGKPIALAFDQYGNAWLANLGQTVTSNEPTSTSPSGTGTVSASVTELGPTGAVLAGPTAVFTALTTDPNGNNYGAYGEFTQAPTTNTRSFQFAAGNSASSGVIAIDLSNNAWVTNNRDAIDGTAATATTATGGTVAVFPGSAAANQTNNGTPFGYYTAYEPDGIAIDAKNNVFIAATAGSTLASAKSISEFALGAGTAFSYSTAAPNTAIPYQIPGGVTKIAIDGNTAATNGPFLWSANFGACNLGTSMNVLGSFNEFLTGTLAPTTNSPFATSSSTCPTSYGIKTPFAAATAQPAFVAIDKNNGVLVTDEYVSSTSGFDGLTYLVTDTNGNVTNSVTYAATAVGTKGSTTVSATSNVADPFGIAVDGNNSVFVGNIGLNSLAQFTLNASASTPSLTFNQDLRGPSASPAGHQYGAPAYIAIDSSGNLWAPNEAALSQSGLPIPGMNRGSTISVTIGVAGPVVTPLAAAIKGSRIGQKP